MNVCPQCGHANRAGARFCGQCAAALALVPQPVAAQAPAAIPVIPSAPPAAAAPAAAPGLPPAPLATAGPPPGPLPVAPGVGAALGGAAAAAAPLVKQAGVGSRRAMGKLAWILTAGGRSAYTEVTGAIPTAEGQVSGAASERDVPLRIEPAALVWLGVALPGWLVFLLPAWQGVALLLGALMALTVVVYLGGRRPYFSALTMSALVDRLRKRGQGRMPMLRFDLQVAGASQPVQVVMLGPRSPLGGQVGAGEVVRVWGIADPGRNELQGWKLERGPAGSQSASRIRTPRLIPLSLALFAPLLLMLVVRLLTLRS